MLLCYDQYMCIRISDIFNRILKNGHNKADTNEKYLQTSITSQTHLIILNAFSFETEVEHRRFK